MIRKNWLILPLIIIGFYYNQWKIQNSDSEMVFQELIYGFLLLIFLLFLSLSIYKDYHKYKLSRSVKNYLPSLVGLLILLSFGVTNLVLSMRDNSPVIIHASYDGDFNGAWFEFRENGTYKFINHAGIGADITRGKYQIKDSLIVLDKSKMGNVIVSNTLAIREENYTDSTKVKMLYQIDRNHSVSSENFKFLINKNVVDLEKP
ncbi:hypothetical protein PGH12_07855 [Chryseobacterium wangxinyae]|uniref:hypothetical protein n=1 Tax=Chryseobacterium sp. CY350 TaxID=2997336 RepID=UPI00226EB010|nr:hypothetical protein [Chryseobacterium sp. CY350]MCY0977059.1 hypothetical protein [Chryseobacterium sp. CY350]WBZ97057.1 hypothetical protein PGH12_07855 [Chryseobacterium sp. CY350]